MRLPHPLNNNLGFLADNADQLIRLIGCEDGSDESSIIRCYFANGLPPVTSYAAIAALFGYNEGFVQSLLYRNRHHYREFKIPKGRGFRTIYAPHVGLKLIQKWLGTHFQALWTTNDSVYGFVPGRSHLAAAARHLGSEWVVSVDIQNFFPSVKVIRVKSVLEQIGYNDEFSKYAIARLTCLNGGLAQGSPASPVLSNIALNDLDNEISKFSKKNNFVYTRYADDLVMSGKDGDPNEALVYIKNKILEDGWNISEHKTSLNRTPHRLKVHGLLVHGDKIRLTKGYRNQIRAYKHLLKKQKIKKIDLSRLRGHIEFSKSVDKFNAQV